MAMSLAVTYFKRYRMEIDLRAFDAARFQLPPGYRLIPWELSSIEQHATVKYRSFSGEIDSQVFPCLGQLSGCQRLMREIARKKGFIPEATWLLVREIPRLFNRGQHDLCGTIQGLVDSQRIGSIQNVGIVPEYRGRGLGTALIAQSLAGFRMHSLNKAYLEVTSQNEAAIRLYRRLGFTKTRTLYKVVEEVVT